MEISEDFWRVISQASEDKPDQKQCHSIHPINSDVEKISGNKKVGMPDFSWCTPHPCREVQNIFFFGEKYHADEQFFQMGWNHTN